MRITIQDQVSHSFIEGPMQSPLFSNYQDGTAEKATNQANMQNEHKAEGDANDANTPYHEANDRFD